MKTREKIDNAIQKLGGLSNVKNLSVSELSKLYRLYMRLYDLIDEESPERFLDETNWCVRVLEQINRAYNSVVGREVDLWTRYLKDISCQKS